MYFQTTVSEDDDFEVVDGVLHVRDIDELFARVPAEGRRCPNCDDLGSS